MNLNRKCAVLILRALKKESELILSRIKVLPLGTGASVAEEVGLVFYRRRDCRPDRWSPVPVRSASLKRLRTNLDRSLSVCITVSEFTAHRHHGEVPIV